MIAHSDVKTKIVPGNDPDQRHHPEQRQRGGLSRHAIKTARDRVAKAKASGMSRQQVMDANLLADLDAKWKKPDDEKSRPRGGIDLRHPLTLKHI